MTFYDEQYYRNDLDKRDDFKRGYEQALRDLHDGTLTCRCPNCVAMRSRLISHATSHGIDLAPKEDDDNE